MTINTTKLPLPDIWFSVPDILNIFTQKHVNLEIYANLPTCNGINNLSAYLGYNID